MKKIIIGIVLAMNAASAIAEPQLPFIGKRFYNFMGGSGTLESVQIKPNGQTIIMMYGTVSSGSIYKGAYKTLIPMGDGLYYRFTKSNVSQVDGNGKVEFGCSGDDEKACIEVLTKEP